MNLSTLDMTSAAEIVCWILAIFVIVIIVLLTWIMISKNFIIGTLVQPPTMTRCDYSTNTQWLIYDCIPNPITGFGCVSPDGSRVVTTKHFAVKQSPCLPPDQQTSGATSRTRVISSQWHQKGQDGHCVNANIEGSTCCPFSGATCAFERKYICISTGQAPGGETLCTPEYFPKYVETDYSPSGVYTVDPVTVKVVCRTNFC